MVTCRTCLIVLLPVLAILIYQGLQTVEVEYEFKTTIRASQAKVYQYLKDPENIRDLVPNVVEVKVSDYQLNVLDEGDGLFKDVYSVTVVQDLSYKSGFTFSFTRKACASQNSIQSQGSMMGMIDYQIINTVDKLDSGSVSLTEHCTMQMPRVLSCLVSGNVRHNHQQLNQRVKDILEKGEKVSGGTQTQD